MNSLRSTFKRDVLLHHAVEGLVDAPHSAAAERLTIS